MAWSTTPSIAIQNTDTAAATSVTVTFTPDPILNPAVGGTLDQPRLQDLSGAARAACCLLDQATQTDPDIGAKFFGSAKVESDVAPVGVVTTSSGGEQVLLAYPSYSAGSTQPIGLPSVYKNVMSAGLSYSTAFLIANMGAGSATVEITYLPTVKGTVAGKDTITIPAGTVKNVDQRYDAPSITSSDFIGAALVTPTAGSVAVMANLRGGSQYAMTYGGLTGGVGSGWQDVPAGGLQEHRLGRRVLVVHGRVLHVSADCPGAADLQRQPQRVSPWTTGTYHRQGGRSVRPAVPRIDLGP